LGIWRWEFEETNGENRQNAALNGNIAASWRLFLTFHLFREGWCTTLLHDDRLDGALGSALADLCFGLLDYLNLVNAEDRAAPKLARCEVITREVASLVLAAALPLRAEASDRGRATRHLARVAAVAAAAEEALARLLSSDELRRARSFTVEGGRKANTRHTSAFRCPANEALASTLVLEAAARGFPGAPKRTIFGLARKAVVAKAASGPKAQAFHAGDDHLKDVQRSR
jgi:hypothetical protein